LKRKIRRKRGAEFVDSDFAEILYGEGGGRPSADRQPRAQVDMHRAGLTALAAVTSTLPNASTNIAAGLLRARYFLHLYTQASTRCA